MKKAQPGNRLGLSSIFTWSKSPHAGLSPLVTKHGEENLLGNFYRPRIVCLKPRVKDAGWHP
jgi:hypothetical protein